MVEHAYLDQAERLLESLGQLTISLAGLGDAGWVVVYRLFWFLRIC
jgi:hypothetical protein